jgi:hypothetical protein
LFNLLVNKMLLLWQIKKNSFNRLLKQIHIFIEMKTQKKLKLQFYQTKKKICKINLKHYKINFHKFFKIQEIQDKQIN